jgi:pimeloyl-ACP methyl ester carboxylesterase
MPQFFTASDGARLAFADQGTGLPLLCLPGLTRTMQDFDYLAPHLPPLRLIRVDYRGRGDSDWTGAATYTIVQEAADAVALMDHLAIDRCAILGTSRGGLIGMLLAATAKARLLGLCLNDIGPVIDRVGLERIGTYLGRPPAAKTHAEMAIALAETATGFANVPAMRWLDEARHLYDQTPDGLLLRYDPALRDAFLEGAKSPPPDLWPYFDACAGLPLALIRGANSDLISARSLAEMQARRPDMITATVPDRAHIPFLDEPESLGVVHAFLRAVGA